MCVCVCCISYNLSQLEDWVRGHRLTGSDVLSQLLPSVEAAKLLQMKKSTPKDADSICELCTNLNPLQVTHTHTLTHTHTHTLTHSLTYTQTHTHTHTLTHSHTHTHTHTLTHTYTHSLTHTHTHTHSHSLTHTHSHTHSHTHTWDNSLPIAELVCGVMPHIY